MVQPNEVGLHDRAFDVIFVRPPPNSYGKCVSTNPAKDTIDVTLAKEQHRQYVSILKETGVDVIELKELEAFPDSVFMQDPALLGSRQAVIGRFSEKNRQGEENALVKELGDYADRVGKTDAIRAPGTLEGGDILLTDREIFVGESTRTNKDGIKQLAGFLSEKAVRGVRTHLFHLLCGCSYLSNGVMMIAPDLIDPGFFPNFRFIKIPESEAYATDALHLGEGKVLIPAGYPETVKKLKEEGYHPIEVHISEFWKGDGGATCLSSPVYKLF